MARPRPLTRLREQPKNDVREPVIAFSFSSTWQRFWRMPTPNRRLVVETMLGLALARIVIALLPVRRIGWLASWPARRPEPPPTTRTEIIRRIRWAITACASHAPWRAMCFEQGLAAQFLLRRRGIPAVLYVGAALDSQTGFAAHVWVRDGEVDVVGGEASGRFGLLTSFPPRP